ncbi:MAG: cysteine desulfurase-like protein [Gemmatimonadota bacterium]|nr:MAG: cysteine desulfurase-like protein [Gemmatimonadota bacterium]
MTFDPYEIRSHFPALQSGAIFFDGPGGTQVPQEVIEACGDYLRTANANLGGTFETSRRTIEVMADARRAMADFLNARSPEEIVFGPNMTTLTFNLSRAVGRTLHAGDEIIVTALDHDANIAPWVALEERGIVIQWVDINPEDCTLHMADMKRHLSMRTEIVAVAYASNAVGTINDLKRIIDLAHERNALVFVDAVHYAPHGPIDVQELDCDFLTCSAYKFFGPHVGVLYGKYDLLEKLPAYKVRPARDRTPDKLETGTQNHEGIAGVVAAIDYLTSIGEKYGIDAVKQYQSFTGRRFHLKTAMAAIQQYESKLFTRLMEGLQGTRGIEIYGITNPKHFNQRTPTVAFTMEKLSPREISGQLAQENIYVWDGNYYALEIMERLGLEKHGGAVRVGLCHYNTAEEVDRFLEVLGRIQSEES